MNANPFYVLNTLVPHFFLNEPLDEAYNECPGNAAKVQRRIMKGIIQKTHSCLNWHFKCHFSHLICNLKNLLLEFSIYKGPCQS